VTCFGRDKRSQIPGEAFFGDFLGDGSADFTFFGGDLYNRLTMLFNFDGLSFVCFGANFWASGGVSSSGDVLAGGLAIYTTKVKI